MQLLFFLFIFAPFLSHSIHWPIPRQDRVPRNRKSKFKGVRMRLKKRELHELLNKEIENPILLDSPLMLQTEKGTVKGGGNTPNSSLEPNC